MSEFPAQPFDPADHIRPPESEIYGRSLSTMHRFGAFILKHGLEEAIDSPEAAQAEAEFSTSVKEGFGTDMELGGGLEVREFDMREVIDGRVMAKDLKTAISGMTEAGLISAREKAGKDPRFLPQLTRSGWDHENALIVDEMANGRTGYNTRIVASPFPEEAAKKSGNAYWRREGYVPHLKRGFIQLYHVTEDGQLLTGSLSFDGSNKQKLREIFGRFGVEIPEGESTDNWLKYAITGTLTDDEARALATEIADMAGDPKYKKTTNTVDVTKQYEPLMKRTFRESYAHVCEALARGRQTEGVRGLIYQLASNAHSFNERYAKALYGMRANGDLFTDDDTIVLHELLVYSTIEMMRALHLQKTYPSRGLVSGTSTYSLFAYLQAAESSQFQNMLSGFGADGARNNRGYSACGLEIFLGDKDSQNNPQSAFGGQDKLDDEDNLGSRWFTCSKKHLNYRRVPNVKEKTCRTCGEDISCEPARIKIGALLSWEQAFGVKPKKVEGLKGVGKRALAGAGKS